jgi:hypothetical protein
MHLLPIPWDATITFASIGESPSPFYENNALSGFMPQEHIFT